MPNRPPPSAPSPDPPPSSAVVHPRRGLSNCRLAAHRIHALPPLCVHPGTTSPIPTPPKRSVQLSPRHRRHSLASHSPANLSPEEVCLIAEQVPPRAPSPDPPPSKKGGHYHPPPSRHPRYTPFRATKRSVQSPPRRPLHPRPPAPISSRAISPIPTALRLRAKGWPAARRPPLRAGERSVSLPCAQPVPLQAAGAPRRGLSNATPSGDHPGTSRPSRCRGRSSHAHPPPARPCFHPQLRHRAPQWSTNPPRRHSNPPHDFFAAEWPPTLTGSTKLRLKSSLPFFLETPGRQ